MYIIERCVFVVRGLCPVQGSAPNNDINYAVSAFRSLDLCALGFPGFDIVSYFLLKLPEQLQSRSRE